jgi:hypothetical protein
MAADPGPRCSPPGPDQNDGGTIVSDLPTPTAARLPRARWLDARLLVGLFLVLVSVVVGARVFADADDRVQVWSATRDLGADTPLTGDDVEATSVRLDRVAGRYVSAAEDLEGSVLTRPVGRGELVPVGSVGAAGSLDQRRVVIEVDRFGVVGLARGRKVDLYVVRAGSGSESPSPPELVLAGVTVGEDVRSGGSSFGGGGAKVGLTLLVDQEDVPEVIDAVANGAVYVAALPGAGAERVAQQ